MPLLGVDSLDMAGVARFSSPLVSCTVALMMTLILLVGDAAAVSYTRRTSDSIVGAAPGQAQGNYVSMSSNGLVSLSLSGDGTTAPVLAVAASPGATTTQTSLSVPPPSPCIDWGSQQPSVSSSGNMFAVSCFDPSSVYHTFVYRTSSPSAPVAMIASANLPAISADGSTLAVASGMSIAIYQLSMGSYTLKQTLAWTSLSSTGIGTITIAPDASAFAVSDQVSFTELYGWDSSTSQFVLAPSMPLSVGCTNLAASSQSSSGATAIVCSGFPSFPIYSLVNTMGSLLLSTQATISGSVPYAAAITPDGPTVAVSDGFDNHRRFGHHWYYDRNHR